MGRQRASCPRARAWLAAPWARTLSRHSSSTWTWTWTWLRSYPYETHRLQGTDVRLLWDADRLGNGAVRRSAALAETRRGHTRARRGIGGVRATRSGSGSSDAP